MAGLSELPISPTARKNLMTRRAPVSLESLNAPAGDGMQEESLPEPDGADLTPDEPMPEVPVGSAESVLDGLSRGNLDRN
jgi:hypothetical protein